MYDKRTVAFSQKCCKRWIEAMNASRENNRSAGEKFAIEHKTEVETCTTEYIRRLLCVLKEIKKRVEKHERNDIRSYL